MPQHLEAFIASKRATINSRAIPPLILKWIESEGMLRVLEVIDLHVEYLKQNPGGLKKLDQWLLANERNFYDITAERYIICHLVKHNANIQDNLDTEGVDAILKDASGDIGIEVTTLNSFVGESILMERLAQAQAKNVGLKDAYFHIDFTSYEQIELQEKGGRIHKYIEEIATAIEIDDRGSLTKLGVAIGFPDLEGVGGFSLSVENTDEFPMIEVLTEELLQKLQKGNKARQLKMYERNIVFVGVNHLGPGKWDNPALFQFLVSEPDKYNPHLAQVEALEKFWAENMHELGNVIGICYFVYSLDQEHPFYPLRIFWRSPEDQIELTL